MIQLGPQTSRTPFVSSPPVVPLIRQSFHTRGVMNDEAAYGRFLETLSTIITSIEHGEMAKAVSTGDVKQSGPIITSESIKKKLTQTTSTYLNINYKFYGFRMLASISHSTLAGFFFQRCFSIRRIE